MILAHLGKDVARRDQILVPQQNPKCSESTATTMSLKVFCVIYLTDNPTDNIFTVSLN